MSLQPFSEGIPARHRGTLMLWNSTLGKSLLVVNLGYPSNGNLQISLPQFGSGRNKRTKRILGMSRPGQKGAVLWLTRTSG
jgi:hypothetical protein